MTDDGMLAAAFDRGASSSGAGKSVQDNPYRPEFEYELYECWNLGFAEAEGPDYKIVERKLA